MDTYIKANQKLWNDWAGFHPETEMYNMEAFKKGATSLMPLELNALGDVKGKTLLHLQCHFGQDTISWARRGARATGVDFSETAIATAKGLAKELESDTEFVQSNVLELNLGMGFDFVFTSYGVLVWLPDLDKWAEVVSKHLNPGGTFYIVEFHPGLMMFDFDTAKYAYAYFKDAVPYKEEVTGSYADPEEGTVRTEYSWSYSLSEIIAALMSKGLLLDAFEEYPYSPYDCFPNMVKRNDGMFESELLKGAPHLFSLKMHKPA
ncbi:MAG: class I SAM-dependent methyltransferase [Phaeodactylibacter sp.]|nr:class I SAM-dependent methyltransferase [Phaeodactylibacter sp.]